MTSFQDGIGSRRDGIMASRTMGRNIMRRNFVILGKGRESQYGLVVTSLFIDDAGLNKN